MTRDEWKYEYRRVRSINRLTSRRTSYEQLTQIYRFDFAWNMAIATGDQLADPNFALHARCERQLAFARSLR